MSLKKIIIILKITYEELKDFIFILKFISIKIDIIDYLLPKKKKKEKKKEREREIN